MNNNRKKQSAQRPSLFYANLPRRALNLAILAILYPSFSYANPDGAQVVSGQVSIDTATPGVTTITNSPNAIINWQNFSIAQNEITQFIQQNGQSAVLNRIIGQNPSEILGQLTSNGKVFLINPNGIVFGQGATIDTQGLIASSLNLSDQDFLSGNYHFMAGSSAGNILNEGIIRAGKDGNIILIAPQIQNNGIIKSDGGSITLAAGQELTITNLDDPDIRFQIQAPTDSALNLGKLLTEGGAINVFASTIKHSGEINADSVQIDKQGNIQLVAQQDITLAADSKISANNSQGDAGTIHIDSKTGTTLAQGSIEAQATQAGKGGNIELLGEQVGVLDQAKIDASGANGGGQVLIGGDYQGKNADVHNAKATYLDKDSTITADAKTDGDGGNVIVWSDETTRVYGNISAQGGINGGNGGFVETSGHNYLDFQGLVDTSAILGTAGTLLLDPADIVIDNSADYLNGGSLSGGIFSGATGNSVLTWNTINAQSGNLEIQTNSSGTGGSGNININASGTVTGPSSLTLLANNNINFANGVSVSSTGDVNLIAGWNNTGWAVTPGTGNISFSAYSSLSTVGDVWLNAGNAISQESTSQITADTLSIGNTNGGNLPGGVSLLGNNIINTLAAQIDGGGNFTFSNGKALTIGTGTYFNGISGNSSAINIISAGDVTIGQNVSSAGSVSITAGGAITEAGGIINTTGLLTTNSIGGTTLNGANTVGSFNATNATSGNVEFNNTATNLTLTGISNSAANGDVTVATTGMITNSASINANNIKLKADKMTLAGGTINGSSSVNLLSSNAIVISDVFTHQLGTLELSNSDLNTITSPILRIGDISSGAIDIQSPLALLNFYTTLSLTSGGAITQQAGATIAVSELNASGASVTLTEANPVGVISGSASSSGGQFSYTSANPIHVTTVDGVSGITTNNGNVSLTAASGDLNISKQINAGTGTVKLNATSGSVSGTGLNPDIIAGNVNISAYNNIFGWGGLRIYAPLISQLSATTGSIAIESLSGGTIMGAVSAYDDIKIRASSPLSANSGITSTIGDIYLSATALNINSLINAGSAEVELETDALTWDASGNGQVIGNLINIQTYTDGLPITVGASCIGGAGTCLSVTELWRVISPTIGIGSDLTGDIFVSGITNGVSTLTDRNTATTRIGLISNGGITQSTSAIDVQDLGIEANGEVILNAANKISNLAATTWGHNLTFNNAQGISIIQMSGGATPSNYYDLEYNIVGIDTCSLVSCGDLTLSSTGAITETSAPITAGSLAIKSGGDVHLADLALNAGTLEISAGGNIYSRSMGVSQMTSLNATNGWIDVENIGGFMLGSTAITPGTTVANAAGNIMIKAMSPLTVNGAVTSSGGGVGLTASNGDTLAINAPISASNGISLTGGTLTGSYADSYLQYLNNGTGTDTSGSKESAIETLSNTVTDSTEQVTAGVLGTTPQSGGQLLVDESNISAGESTAPISIKGKNSRQCTK